VLSFLACRVAADKSCPSCGSACCTVNTSPISVSQHTMQLELPPAPSRSHKRIQQRHARGVRTKPMFSRLRRHRRWLRHVDQPRHQHSRRQQHLLHHSQQHCVHEYQFVRSRLPWRGPDMAASIPVQPLPNPYTPLKPLRDSVTCRRGRRLEAWHRRSGEVARPTCERPRIFSAPMRHFRTRDAPLRSASRL
jgi:hypothetical protein